jgi:hypothetical protein
MTIPFLEEKDRSDTHPTGASESGLILPAHLMAFTNCCQHWDVKLVLAGASDKGALHLGKPGLLPMILPTGCWVRNVAPNEGLIAFQAGDSSLPDQLELPGIFVASADEGYALMDRGGHRFFQTYDLYGVFAAQTGGNAFAQDQGRAIGADLNRRLGRDLILQPPNGLCVDEGAGRPNIEICTQTPILVVHSDPDRDVQRLTSMEALETLYADEGFDWPYSPSS